MKEESQHSSRPGRKKSINEKKKHGYEDIIEDESGGLISATSMVARQLEKHESARRKREEERLKIEKKLGKK